MFILDLHSICVNRIQYIIYIRIYYVTKINDINIEILYKFLCYKSAYVDKNLLISLSISSFATKTYNRCSSSVWTNIHRQIVKEEKDRNKVENDVEEDDTRARDRPRAIRRMPMD